jgi:hypothetical protein
LKVGDVAGARLAIHRALALNPHYADARRMRDGLDEQGEVAVRRAA